MNKMELEQAIEIILETRAERFLKNQEYLGHVRRCVKELNFSSHEEAFVFGGLDAMQQDFASANQFNLPAKVSPWDVGYRERRFERLQNWKRIFKEKGMLPL